MYCGIHSRIHDPHHDMLLYSHLLTPRLADLVRLPVVFVAVFIFTVAVTQQDRPSLEMNHVLWVTELSGDPCTLLYHA
ncbi:hypothetical protein N7450_002839 [Penicillium hetheringtonii]|uniref:Uncharacterized protein n=1 Tax=Penicillium hetheringtonii TaxID=911720 RepID=A0AAD6GWN1_9EURO|nr:hypothetical protein N7450_002839 [Penicillium hetheringtonii]